MMTLPNRHLPGQIVHLTRRTSQRQFLLKNGKDGKTKNDLGYLFAMSCSRHNQTPHALTIMSNHHHVCLTDTNNGKRSNFFRDFHHLTTKVNKTLGRRESLWSSNAPGNTLLLDTEAVRKKKIGKTKIPGYGRVLQTERIQHTRNQCSHVIDKPAVRYDDRRSCQACRGGMRSFWRQYKKRLDGFRKGSVAKFPYPKGRLRARERSLCRCWGPNAPSSEP